MKIGDKYKWGSRGMEVEIASERLKKIRVGRGPIVGIEYEPHPKGRYVLCCIGYYPNTQEKQYLELPISELYQDVEDTDVNTDE
jgi:hypothetical protein